jgi:hypothetical protein
MSGEFQQPAEQYIPGDAPFRLTFFSPDGTGVYVADVANPIVILLRNNTSLICLPSFCSTDSFLLFDLFHLHRSLYMI